MSLALTNAIKQALKEFRSENGAKYGHDRFLTIEWFMGAVQGKLGGIQRIIRIQGSQETGKHVCLPNPHFEPSATAPSARRAAISQCSPRIWKSTGCQAPAAYPGWFFAGGPS